MGYFGGFLVTMRQRGGKNQVTTQYSGGRVRRKAISKSKTGESSKRAEIMDEKIAKPERLHGRHVLNRYEDGMEKCCVQQCAQQSAFTFVAPTTTLKTQLRQASALAGSTRSTTCAASIATCAWKHAQPKQSPNQNCSSSRSLIAKTPFIRRPNWWLATTESHSTCLGKTGALAKTNTLLHGCAQPRHRATQASRALLAGAANWVTACVRQNSRAHNGIVRIRLRLNHDSCWRYRSGRS